MLIGVIPWAVVGASLALLNGAEAAPMRMTIISHQEWANSFGPIMGKPEVISITHFTHAIPNENLAMVPKKGCHIKALANSSKMSLSDGIRKALGLPPIEHKHVHDIGTPMAMLMDKPHDPEIHASLWMPHPHLHSVKPTADLQLTHSTPKALEVEREHSFVHRVHTALLQLDTWEARAVAFVLGCGIGVLFRMLWVFLVLIFRGVREEPTETTEQEYTLVLEQVDENLPKYDHEVPLAPAYTDEKKQSAEGA